MSCWETFSKKRKPNPPPPLPASKADLDAMEKRLLLAIADPVRLERLRAILKASNDALEQVVRANQ